MRITNRAILLFILCVAAFLRFYRFSDIPFMHDEFSAVFRTGFNSFRELIDKGVKPDGHPAGIQVFLYYWIKLFGSKEWVVKLPFAVMGVLSVPLIYLIAKKWFNETAGLICAAFLASIQYTVMYSQIARPYISGLFFSLLMVYYWSKLADANEKGFWKNAIPFVLASALCAYNHHFSLLFAALVGITGIFFIPRKFLLQYILCGLLIFILYIPHLGIFFTQLRTGGIGGWLGKPTGTFITDYLAYLFNYSGIAIFISLGLSVLGLVYANKKSIRISIYILFLIWFLVPLVAGFWYSVKINPVLQSSVLIFSFYPLLFVIFGHIPNQKASMNLALVSFILFINTYSLVFGRKHYYLLYNSPFERTVTDYKAAKERVGDSASIVHSHRKITGYYSQKYGVDSTYAWFEDFKNEAEIINFLNEKSKTSDYFFLGALSSVKPNILPIIRQFFPVIQKENNYFLGSTYLFTKSGQDERNIVTKYSFDAPPPEGWRSVSNEKIINENGNGESLAYRMDSLTEWSPTFSAPLRRYITNNNNYIDVTVRMKARHNITEALLIATLESDGEVVHFSGTDFSSFVTPGAVLTGWVTLSHSLKLADMDLNLNNLTLNVFVWNKGKNNLLIDDFVVEAREGNPFIYGLYERIP